MVDYSRLSIAIAIHGVSMWPALRAGDQLVCVPAERFDVGDVVCCRATSHQRVHRVVSRRGAQVILQGDLCPRPDAPMDERAVLFRAVAVVRAGARRPIPRRPRWPALWRRLHWVRRRFA